MKTIEEYAIEMVAEAAEDRAEDDANRKHEIADGDHEAACYLAERIGRAIRAYPDEVLALAQRVNASPLPTKLEE